MTEFWILPLSIWVNTPFNSASASIPASMQRRRYRSSISARSTIYDLSRLQTLIFDTTFPTFLQHKLSMSGNPLVNGWNDIGSGYPQHHSPTYGSLPTFAPPPYSVIFKLVPAESSILNFTVMGINGQSYLTVCSSDAITTFSRRAVELCASIEWQKHAVVEWSNCIARQRVSHWAPLASDRRCVLVQLPYTTQFADHGPFQTAKEA